MGLQMHLDAGSFCHLHQPEQHRHSGGDIHRHDLADDVEIAHLKFLGEAQDFRKVAEAGRKGG